MKFTLSKEPIIFCLLLFHIFTFSQKTTSDVIYKKKFIGKLKEKNDKSDPIKLMAQDHVKIAYENMNILEYQLLFNAKESVYSKKQFLKPENLTPLNLILMEMGFDRGLYYMNYETNKHLRQVNLSSDLFLIESKIESQKWKKTDETKQIGKYTCFKATTKVLEETVSKGTVEKEVVAWFTPEIPISFGPAGFGGLPGLILEIQKGQFILYSEKISLNANTEKIKVPKRGIKVSEEEFREIQKKGSAFYRQYKN